MQTSYSTRDGALTVLMEQPKEGRNERGSTCGHSFPLATRDAS